ncbi:hypothetical protein [Arthrobacter luteolus]|uniref:hypothetical protein n=1 Tax=Arthrobacter luteolus TaxID=98672 RepID=UPI00384B5E6C
MDTAQVRLWWLPVGAGGHLVIHTSRWWELWRSVRERRHPRPLFHAALEVAADGSTYAIEMTPSWGQGRSERGVVAEGPVGLRALGRLKLFRYEVRCWRGGIIPDLGYAPEPPLVFNVSTSGADALRARVPQVPDMVWGAKMPDGDMWNSNSLVSWLLQSSGIDAGALYPPHGGRAPGWRAGIDAAR